jgi:rubredoxin
LIWTKPIEWAILPTIIINQQPKEKKIMDRYVCNLCGYVYDPADGDPDNGIKPGTAFEDLPEDWTCPICGAGKEDFDKE